MKDKLRDAFGKFKTGNRGFWKGKKRTTPSWNKGLKASEDSRIVLTWKGKKMSKEHRKKLSLAKIGKRGPLSSRWNGGRFLVQGYIYVFSPDHPFATKDGYVFEHRLVMEKKLGRLLTKEEKVHHLNHIKTDNRPENLDIMTISEHMKLHHPKGIQPDHLKGLPSWRKGKYGLYVSPMKGKKHSNESKEKNRKAHIGKPAWNKGIPNSGFKQGYTPWNKGKKYKLN